MKKQLIKIIAEYLEKETNVTAEYGSQRIEFGGVLNQGHFTHAGFCKEVAEELAAAIAPHLEAGSDWEDAPEWAEYIATDWNGQKHWFEKEPYKHNSGCWFNQEGTKYQKINYSNGDKWDISLQQRPR